MELVKRGGLEATETHDSHTYYVCSMHREEVFEQPGRCFKEGCAGMELEKLVVSPEAKLVFACPMHPEVVSDAPGKCPKCGMDLKYKVVSDATRVVEGFACPMHPERALSEPAPCPDCGAFAKRADTEELLAVPFEAVIDTGERKVVFIDRGYDTYEAVEVVLGPRAGEFYPVKRGLAAGDRVVAAGAFLLDAESRLNPAAGVVYFGASDK